MSRIGPGCRQLCAVAGMGIGTGMRKQLVSRWGLLTLTKRSTIELLPTADSPVPSQPVFSVFPRLGSDAMRAISPSSTSLNWAKRLLIPRAPGGPRVAMADVCLCGCAVDVGGC